MDRGAAFLKVTRSLGDLDWWVYDRRGYGRSVADTPAEVDDHVADLVAVLEVVVQERRQRPVVAGHSLGGTLALAAAHRRPELVAAVLAYESPLSWTQWWPRRGPGSGPIEEDEPAVAAERFMRRVAGVWEELPAATRHKRIEEGAALVAELRSLRRGAPYDPARISVPVVVARGDRADDFRVRAADELVAAIPVAELAVLADAGHGAHGTRPDGFAELVRCAVGHADRGDPLTL
jgi:pimeloyl-ACP methyl ester carboxylesterase